MGYFISLFKILILAVFAIYAIEPEKVELAEGEMKEIIEKYVQNISDIENKYVVNEKLSKAISRYFKGRLSLFPLYKINLKIDRTPVKIPWTIGEPETDTNIKSRQYYVEVPETNTS